MTASSVCKRRARRGCFPVLLWLTAVITSSELISVLVPFTFINITKKGGEGGAYLVVRIVLNILKEDNANKNKYNSVIQR